MKLASLMSINTSRAALFATMTLGSVPALADVIVDDSPAALGGNFINGVSNAANGQNFLVEFTLSQATWIDGMAIYVPAGDFFSVGAPLTVKIRQNGTGGLPATTNLFEYLTALSGEVTVAAGTGSMEEVSSDPFTPTLLAAGTYWMGESFAGGGAWGTVTSGVSQPSTQVLLNVDAFDACCTGPTFSGFTTFPNIYNLAYQIDGFVDSSDAGDVPEPASMALLGVALTGIAATRRFRRRHRRGDAARQSA